MDTKTSCMTPPLICCASQANPSEMGTSARLQNTAAVAAASTTSVRQRHVHSGALISFWVSTMHGQEQQLMFLCGFPCLSQSHLVVVVTAWHATQNTTYVICCRLCSGQESRGSEMCQALSLLFKQLRHLYTGDSGVQEM